MFLITAERLSATGARGAGWPCGQPLPWSTRFLRLACQVCPCAQSHESLRCERAAISPRLQLGVPRAIELIFAERVRPRAASRRLIARSRM
jgi:hypothetical protein